MKTILPLLTNQAKLRPDAPAFSDEQGTLTFSEVERISDAIGSALLSAGAEKEPVLLFMSRSALEIAAFFGVLKAGCFYVPTDAEMGEQRIRSILARVSPRFAVVDAAGRDVLSAWGCAGTMLDLQDVQKAPIDREALLAAQRKTIDSDAAYLVFTSGSTGAPKGVVGVHRAMLDYANAITTALKADETDVFGMQAPLYVDACLKEILSVLTCGSHAVLIPKRLFLSPVPLVEFLNAHRITTLCWVVPALTMLSALHTFDEIVPKYLKTVAFGSETMPPKQLRIWQTRVPARYLNLYGPTECTGMSCCYEVDRAFSDGERIPIGRAFDNTEIFLLDEHDRRADEGEICIRGTAVCHGYYRDPERTARAFVRNPINAAYPEIIYRTGDLGRFNARGELEFLGRRDDQVKIMGHRVELGELDAAAKSITGVDAACAVFDERTHTLGLVYSGTVEKSALLLGLRTRIADFCLPRAVLRVESLPQTPNGKTNRNACKALLFH